MNQIIDDVRLSEIASSVKDELPRARIRGRLQVMEAWKLDADETELAWIEGYSDYLKYLLDPTHVTTSSHEPGWFEMRRRAGEYHDPEEDDYSGEFLGGGGMYP